MEHLLNAWGALWSPEQWLGTTAQTRLSKNANHYFFEQIVFRYTQFSFFHVNLRSEVCSKTFNFFPFKKTELLTQIKLDNNF